MKDWFDLVPLAIFLAIVGTFVIRAIRTGGFRAAMFGRRIIGTVGEVSTEKKVLTRHTLKVHTLGEGQRAEAIGLEWVSKGPPSYHMMPTTLSLTEARKLVELLEKALANAQPR